MMPESPNHVMLETRTNGDQHELSSPKSNHDSGDVDLAPPGEDTAHLATFSSLVPTPEAMVPLFQSTWGTEPFLPVVYPQTYRQEDQSSSMGVKTTSSDRDAGVTIPAGHLTTTGSIFTIQAIRRMVGDYPPDFFYQIESAQDFDVGVTPSFGQDLSMILGALDLRRDVTDRLVSNFFSQVHPHCPILDQDSFGGFFEKSLSGTCRNPADAALCLVVLALGSQPFAAATNDSAESMSIATTYFEPAYRILTTGWVSSLGTTLSLPSGLVLCAVYLDRIVKPLAAWKLIYMASSTLQLIACQ